MNVLRRVLVLLLVPVTAAGALALRQDAASRPDDLALAGNSGDAFAQLVFFAVLEGCYRDGVETSTVDALLTPAPDTDLPEIFVYACPLCSPAHDALRLYKRRQPFYGMKGEPDTFGPGLSDDVKRALEAPGAATRRDAWEKLVEKWVAQRLTSLRLTPDERKGMDLGLQLRRKAGMIFLERYRASQKPGHYARMKQCPSCDGAADAGRVK
jgi:hypothetical protein